MAVRVYQPTLTVTLTRLVNRTSGSGVATTLPYRTVDLTPLLGPGGSVRTIKDIHQPCGGFSISFADRKHDSFADTVYALAEPMDLVEIRASRTPERYQGTTLPLLMRGFVSNVERSEHMGEEGEPERTVTIHGQDMGKLFMINHIYFEVAVLTDNDYLTTFHLFSSLGIQVGVIPVNAFMHQLVENVINKKIEQLSVFSDTQLTPFIVEASVPDGQVLPQLAMTLDQIPVWALAELFSDRPWNELFIQDSEDGPHFIFRPAPYRDLYSREYILNGAVDPGTIEVDIKDVVSITMARSDTRIANFFFVPPGASAMDTNSSLNMASLQSGQPLDFGYDNNKPELFGVRKMSAGSNLIAQDQQAAVNMLPVGERSAELGKLVTWFQARTLQLKQMNRDNSVFEEGGLVIKGSEDIIAGKYLRLTRGALISEQYITQVAHTYIPLQNWSTSVHCIRGTGYKTRNEITAGSPYVSEGRRGPYTKD